PRVVLWRSGNPAVHASRVPASSAGYADLTAQVIQLIHKPPSSLAQLLCSGVTLGTAATHLNDCECRTMVSDSFVVATAEEFHVLAGIAASYSEAGSILDCLVQVTTLGDLSLDEIPLKLFQGIYPDSNTMYVASTALSPAIPIFYPPF